jgi:hypothetical protein
MTVGFADTAVAAERRERTMWDVDAGFDWHLGAAVVGGRASLASVDEEAAGSMLRATVC